MDIHTQNKNETHPRKRNRRFNAAERSQALALIDDGETFARAGASIGASAQAVRNWDSRRAEQNNTSSPPVTISGASPNGLIAALERIRTLERENEILRAACALLAQSPV